MKDSGVGIVRETAQATVVAARSKLRLLDLVSERELNVTDYRQIGRFLQLGTVSVSGKGQVENIIRMVYI